MNRTQHPVPVEVLDAIDAAKLDRLDLPGLVVRCTVRDLNDEHRVLDFSVDYTTVLGRRAIAQTAQWAMTRRVLSVLTWPVPHKP